MYVCVRMHAWHGRGEASVCMSLFALPIVDQVLCLGAWIQMCHNKLAIMGYSAINRRTRLLRHGPAIVAVLGKPCSGVNASQHACLQVDKLIERIFVCVCVYVYMYIRV